MSSISSSSSVSSESSPESNENWDVTLYGSLMLGDFNQRKSASIDSASLGAHFGAQSKRPKVHVDEKEIKKSIRKRRAAWSMEERRKEDKEAEKRYRFTFTKLFSHDIRRYISQMHLTAVNSPDAYVQIQNFFNNFALPTVQCTNLMASSIYAKPVSFLLEREDVIDLWTTYIGTHPDAATKLLATQIVRKYNSKTSEVRMTFHFRGTYEKVINIPTNANFDQSISTMSTTSGNITAPLPVYPARQVLQLTPVNIVMYIGFHMNADNFITNISLDARFVPDPSISHLYVTYKAENMAKEVVVSNSGSVVGLKGGDVSDRVEEVFE